MLLFLQSCMPFGSYQNAIDASSNFFKKETFKITPQIEKLPYAMQLVEHQSKNTLMVLAHYENEHLTWVDSQNNGFTTLHGKIISSNGLVNDFENLHPPNLLIIFEKLNKNPFTKINKESLVRFLNPQTTYLNALHSFSLIKPEPGKLFKRRIDGKLIKFLMLQEEVTVQGIFWRYTNVYWLDVNGNVLKSKQYISPDSPKYFLETIKSFKI